MAHVPSDERRRQIIDAAIDVIATEGYARTTTRRIAERADAPLASLHYCFRSKTEIIEQIAQRGSEMLEGTFVGVDPDRGIEATIRGSIAALWSWYQENVWLQFALTELGMARIRMGGDPKIVYGSMWGPFGRDLLTDHFERAVKSDTEQLSVPIGEIVRFIIHRFDGLTIEYAASQDDVACQRQVGLLADAMVAVALPRHDR